MSHSEPAFDSDLDPSVAFYTTTGPKPRPKAVYHLQFRSTFHDRQPQVYSPTREKVETQLQEIFRELDLPVIRTGLSTSMPYTFRLMNCVEDPTDLEMAEKIEQALQLKLFQFDVVRVEHGRVIH